MFILKALLQVGAIFLVLGILFFIVIFIAGSVLGKKEKEYRDKYVTEVPLNDCFFGDVVWEKDSNTDSMKTKNLGRTFGKHNPIITIEEYDDNEQNLYFRALERVYRDQEKIIETMKHSFLEYYADDEKVTSEKLEEAFMIDGIRLEKCPDMFNDYVFQDGEVFEGEDVEFKVGEWMLVISSDVNKNKVFEHYYAKEPVVYMNCKTKQMCIGVDE